MICTFVTLFGAALGSPDAQNPMPVGSAVVGHRMNPIPGTCNEGKRCPLAAAPTGSMFLAATKDMDTSQREDQVLAQLLQRNMPKFLQNFSMVVTSKAAGHTVLFRALPDYVSIGDSTDFVRIPVAAFTAQRVADAFNASLPTTKMVDLLWAAAPVHVAPKPLPPSSNMTSNAYFGHENNLIEQELEAAGRPARSNAWRCWSKERHCAYQCVCKAPDISLYLRMDPFR